MSDITKIQWTNYTFNPWMGCTKVSPGCAHCYAETLIDIRWGKAKWGKGQPRVRTSKANWNLPAKWNRAAADEIAEWGKHSDLHGGHAHYDKPKRPMVFCASLADWLDDEVPIEWLADLLKLIHDTPHLTWQLLTKRPGNFKSRLIQAAQNSSWADPMDVADKIAAWANGERIWHNVWLGTSVEDQAAADLRIPQLLSIPAKVRFLSVEPMLERIDFSKWIFWDHIKDELGKHSTVECEIDWVIIGGESGKKARRCDLDWIVCSVAQFLTAGVPVFVKQLGGNLSDADLDECGLGSGRSMQDPKGGDMMEWPPALRVREFPV